MPNVLMPQMALVASSKGMHTHPEGQFDFATQGLIMVQTGDRRCIMPPGRLGWIPPQVAHGAAEMETARSQPRDQLVGYTLHIRVDLCERLPKEPLVLDQSDLTRSLLTRMQRWSPDEARSEEGYRMLRVLIDEIASATPVPLSLAMPQLRQLRMLASTLVKDPADETSLDEWAIRLGMSRRSITRHFREETGMSVVELRQIARLQRGMEMLDEHMSVTQVAFSLGYESVSSFISLFKRIIGITPAKYASLKSGG